MPVRAKPFSAAEIRTIFGRRKVSGALGNRILSVLHGRRLSGTLDLDLPADITSSVPQSTLDAGLKWLRINYPIDEDAAILARIEREELEEEQRLIRRAEELGLYKPQSGSFGAERSEEDGVWGKSILKNIRQRNEARLLAEEERRRKEWLEGEQREREALQRQIQQNTSLQKFEESAVVEGEIIFLFSVHLSIFLLLDRLHMSFHSSSTRRSQGASCPCLGTEALFAGCGQ